MGLTGYMASLLSLPNHNPNPFLLGDKYSSATFHYACLSFMPALPRLFAGGNATVGEPGWLQM